LAKEKPQEKQTKKKKKISERKDRIFAKEKRKD
jgi:hypothetical protein